MWPTLPSVSITRPYLRPVPAPLDAPAGDVSVEILEKIDAEAATVRPVKRDVLGTGPLLRDLEAAVDCICACHPSPATMNLHNGGVSCNCQLTATQRAEQFNELLAAREESLDAFGADDAATLAAFAAVSAELTVEADLRSWEFPLVVAGTCDGRSFFFRERGGSWSVQIAADAACGDLWDDSRATGIKIAGGDSLDLRDHKGGISPASALRCAVDAVRLSALRNSCPHEQPPNSGHRFCRRCGVELQKADLWRWPR